MATIPLYIQQVIENSPATGDVAARVEHVYDRFRTARMNAIYYGRQLTFYRRTSICFDAIIAVSGPSAAGAWAIWKEEPWSYLYAVLGSIAVVLSVLKPIFGFQRSIERYSKLWARYTDITCQLESLVAEIKTRQGWTDEFNKVVEDCARRMRELSGDDDSSCNTKALERIKKEVEDEIPADSFWMPS